MFDPQQLERLGGWPAVARHSLRLLMRAWQPAWNFIGFPTWAPVVWAGYEDTPTLESIFAATQILIEPGPARIYPPPQRVATGGTVRLPEQPLAEPYGHQSHPDVVAMARAVAATLPALALAIHDERVPIALSRGPMPQARLALADLYTHTALRIVPYSDLDAHEVVEPLLGVWGAGAPLELTDGWNWIVNVGRDEYARCDGHPVEDAGGEQRVDDGHSMQAFARLGDAKLYALLQADHTRDLVRSVVALGETPEPGVERDEIFSRAVVDPLMRYDGRGTVKVLQPGGSLWTTTIIARDRRPAPLLPAGEDHGSEAL